MPSIRSRVALTCALAVCAAAPAANADAGQRAVRPLSATGPLGAERLSDGWRVDRYAGAVARAVVRALPATSAAALTRLHYLTEDGPFEVYPVLASEVDASGRVWLRIRLPMRPNGRTGWIPRN